MQFKLVTPEKTIYEGPVQEIHGRAPSGDFVILEGHVDWVSPIEIDAMTIVIDAENSTYFAVHGGVIEVTPTATLVLADIAEQDEDIDHARATAALERANDKLASKPDKLTHAHNKRAVARAEARIEAVTAGHTEHHR